MSSEVVSNSALRLDTGFKPLFQVPSRNLINVARVLTDNDGDFSLKYSVANLPKETAGSSEEFIKQQQAFVKDYSQSLRRFTAEQRAFVESIRESSDRARAEFDKLANNRELTRFEKLLEFTDNTRANIQSIPLPEIPEPPPDTKENKQVSAKDRFTEAQPTQPKDIDKPKAKNAEDVFKQRQDQVEKTKNRDDNPLFKTTERRNDQFKADKRSQDDDAVQQRLDRGRTERAKALRELEDKTTNSTDDRVEKRKEAIRAKEAKWAYQRVEQQREDNNNTDQTRRSA